MTLAESDEHESVRGVQEFYADYIPVSPTLFLINVPNGCYQYQRNFHQWNQIALQRSIEGIISVLLTLQKYPKIRYQGSSEMCYKLAEGIDNFMNKEHSLFSEGFHDTCSPLLLILDRRSDPYTPLLNQVGYD